MVSIVPFLPSFGWYAEWLKALRAGNGSKEAVTNANNSYRLSGKDYARTRIAGNEGTLLLSIPIVEGSSILKRMANLPEAMISEHGNWRHVHLGAFDASYGRAPFFPHIFPELRQIYSSQAYPLLQLFNEALHNLVCSLLDLDSVGTAPVLPTPVRERAEELIRGINPEISIIDPLMRFGREALLPLIQLSLRSN